MTITIMRHSAPDSTSSFESGCVENASTRQSSLDTAPSTAPLSSSSSVKSRTHTLPTRPKRSSLKSGLKTSKSAPSLAVRFEVPDLPEMPRVEPDAPLLLHKDGSHQPAKKESHAPAHLTTPATIKPVLRKKLSKRFSAPVSRKENKRTSEQPLPLNPRNPSAPTSTFGSRATSFQSVASAPAVLLSTTPSPSQPPSQYQPLQHHIPCVIENCTTHYTTSLLGLTFYSPQQPYQLTRKRALCPRHATQDLKLADHKAKCMWESMRQNAGRKTLGLIAAEFEIWIQQCREERAWESEDLEARQKRRLLGSAKSTAKGKERADEDWDWRYMPRPCTKKGCGEQWYSPFDNRLYLFYHTARASGLLPLTTLCPSCARADVESAEDRFEMRSLDAGAGPEWKEWCVQVKNDRRMEEEYWMQAQERAVREKAATPFVGVDKEVREKETVVEKKSRKGDRLKGICVVM